MSKRPRFGDAGGTSNLTDDSGGSIEHIPPLSPPLHHIPLPGTEIPIPTLSGCDPISVSVSPTHQELAPLSEPCLPTYFQQIESPTSYLPDLGHETPAFPDFKNLPSPDYVEEGFVEGVASIASYGEVCSVTEGENNSSTETGVLSTLPSSSLTMEMDYVSINISDIVQEPSTQPVQPELEMEPVQPELEMQPVQPELEMKPDESLVVSIEPLHFNDTPYTVQEGICNDLPFSDACEYFEANQIFCEEVDPTLLGVYQEDGENVFAEQFFETEQFYDALDTASSSFCDNSYQEGADVPLYEGAKVTVHDAATALLTFLLGCKISGSVFSHLLALLNLLLPENHKLFKTIYSFHNHFKDLESPLSLIHFCSICCQSLESKNSLCTNCKEQTKVGFYIHLPLADQLKRLYARPGFTNLLSYRHERSKKCADNYEDIYDGEVYKSFAPTMGPLDISCMWSTDGISLYSSSSFQVWPFYFSINELPPHLRHKEENILLGGIAFGYEKPHPNLLLKPMYEEVKLLQTRGIEVTVPHLSSPVNIKCNILCGSCDAPAKACFLRMIQFNGHHGCHLCLTKGEKSEETGNVFVYPFEDVLEMRTLEQYKIDVVDQEHGIKGPTYLFYMVWSFFLSSTAIDVMHCVYLGVCRQLFSLYLSSEHIKTVFGENVDKKSLVDTLSKMFCSFNPPHYFSRPPRNLKHLQYFKASEFRVWLFSTALPVFEKFMKEPYLSHFKKLVCAICQLNQCSVSKTDIVVARQLIKSFVQQWQQLFGLRHMSYNVHCLLHLPDVVEQLGPLWVSSCFGYENINGILARLVHGTRYAGLQIQTNVGLLRNVPTLINSIVNSSVKMFCLSAMSHHNRLDVTEKIDTSTYVIGKLTTDHYLEPVYSHILQEAYPNITPYFFLRLKSGFLYVCEDYGRGVRGCRTSRPS